MPTWIIQRLRFLARGIGLMTRREQAKTVGIVALMMVGGLFESAILALVVPLVYVIVDPAKLASTSAGRLIEAWLGTGIGKVFPYLAFLLILLIVVSSTITMVAHYLAEKHSSNARARLVSDLLNRCINAPYIWLTQKNTAVISRRLSEDTKTWYREFIHSLIMIVQAMIMILTPAMVAIAIAPSEGLSALGIVAIVCFGVILLSRRRMRTNAEALRLAMERSAKNLLQILTGVREIKVAGRRSYFTDRFLRDYKESNRIATVTRIWSMAPSAIINGLGQIGFLLTAFVFWYRGTSGSEIVAQLALIGVVVTRVLPAFNRLAAECALLFHSIPYVEGIFQIQNEIEKADRNYGRNRRGDPVPKQWRTLELNNVTVRYPNADGESLRGISLKLDHGRFYGLVGRSGAGKSTLVNTLLGLIEPTDGEVRVDGLPLVKLSLAGWQSRFGYVAQDPFILDASIRENVAFGEEPDDARINNVLSDVKLDGLVAAAPDGLGMQLGERGRRISGGQCQRVAIARALYKNCNVLLLDEATSALDSITEGEIYETLDGLRGKMLAVMIAHRVTSLRRCDKIFVLDGGCVIESGTYDELLGRSSLFRALAAESETATAIAV